MYTFLGAVILSQKATERIYYRVKTGLSISITVLFNDQMSQVPGKVASRGVPHVLPLRTAGGGPCCGVPSLFRCPQTGLILPGVLCRIGAGRSESQSLHGRTLPSPLALWS